MPTAIDIIRPALQMIEILGIGTEVSVPATYASTSLERLNALIGLLRSRHGFVVLARMRRTVVLPAGQATRTIGPTGHLVVEQPPTQIRPTTDRVAIVPVGMTDEIPLRILLPSEWQAIPHKAMTADWPTAVAYEPTPGNGTLSFWPVPTTAPTVVVYESARLSSFADLNVTSYTLPDGVDLMLQANLAELLAVADFGKDVPPRVEKLAVDTLAAVRINSEPPQELQLDPALPGLRRHYDIYRGY